MHNLAPSPATRRRATPPVHPDAVRPRLSATHVIRPAVARDAEQIAALVERFAADGRMLARSASQIALRIDDYVVAVDAHGSVAACAALDEYSPSLAEVASVAVVPAEQGMGLGSAVVQAVERNARRRGIRELFAMTLSDGFFASLGYAAASLHRYPEKLERYARLRAAGIPVVEKPCVAKRVGRNVAA